MRPTTVAVDWLAENRHWLLFAGFVLTGFAAVGVAVVGVVATVSTLVTGGALVPTVGGFLLGTLLLVGLNIVLAAGLLSELARRASLPSVPTDQRVADACHYLEALFPPLGRLGLGDRFEPSLAERRAALTDRYVAGELTEAELEAELSALLDAEAPPETEPERGDTAPEREAERDVETEGRI